MTLNLKAKIYNDENAARKHLERIQWPDGPICPHCGVINEELSELHVWACGNTTSHQVSMEVLIKKLSSEFRVEGTAIGDEGASLGDITDESLFQGLELVGVSDPTLLVVLK